MLAAKTCLQNAPNLMIKVCQCNLLTVCLCALNGSDDVWHLEVVCISDPKGRVCIVHWIHHQGHKSVTCTSAQSILWYYTFVHTSSVNKLPEWLCLKPLLFCLCCYNTNWWTNGMENTKFCTCVHQAFFIIAVGLAVLYNLNKCI